MKRHKYDYPPLPPELVRDIEHLMRAPASAQ